MRCIVTVQRIFFRVNKVRTLFYTVYPFNRNKTC